MTEQRIAHYNLLEPIGEGGLGKVFRARDTKVGRTVALKVLPERITADPPRLERLEADARAASALSHPNIATLFEIGDADETRYLSYEYVGGSSLAAELGGAPMNLRRALEIVVQVADALAQVHAAGLVHGDLRPSTIALTGKGSAKLLETGMSRWTRGGDVRRAAADNASLLPGEASSVVRYMSPEQALGGEVDGRSDGFSLASILYEMLTGRTAFTGATPQDTVLSVISYHPPAASSVNSEVVPELDGVLARALSKDISQRHQSAASFASELRGVLSTLTPHVAEEESTYVLPVDDRADKMPASVWLAGVATAAVVAAIVWWALK